jgi:hypothetical protein
VTATLKVPGEVLFAVPDVEQAPLPPDVMPLLSSNVLALSNTCWVLPEGYETGVVSFTSACGAELPDWSGGILAGREHATPPNNRNIKSDSFTMFSFSADANSLPAFPKNALSCPTGFEHEHTFKIFVVPSTNTNYFAPGSLNMS